MRSSTVLSLPPQLVFSDLSFPSKSRQGWSHSLHSTLKVKPLDLPANIKLGIKKHTITNNRVYYNTQLISTVKVLLNAPRLVWFKFQSLSITTMATLIKPIYDRKLRLYRYMTSYLRPQKYKLGRWFKTVDSCTDYASHPMILGCWLWQFRVYSIGLTESNHREQPNPCFWLVMNPPTPQMSKSPPN